MYIRIILVIGAFLVILWCNGLIRILKHRRQISEATKEFVSYMQGVAFFNYRKYLAWKRRYKALEKVAPFFWKTFPLSSSTKKTVEDIRLFFREGEKLRNKYNDEFCENELKLCKALFDNLENYPLTEKQRRSIVHDEDNNLVIAGAGTGKTTTIVGKAAYLIRRLNIRPEQILLLAFTNKACEEMKRRIEERVGVEIPVKTFHKFGYEIVTEVEQIKPAVAFGDDYLAQKKFVSKIVEDLSEQNSFSSAFGKFLVSFAKPYKSAYSSSSVEQDENESFRTLNGEKVKSFEELEIANFLFLNQIRYVYEQPYKYDTSNKEFSQYKPDFFLPDYDIYIEHFAIDSKGNVPPFFKGRGKLSAKETYHKSMHWKRETHRKFGTKLIETFHYEKAKGILLKNLTNKLLSMGVRLRPMMGRELVAKLKERDSFSPYVDLITTFLNLYRSNALSVQELKTRVEKSNDKDRAIAFMEVCIPVIEQYETRLKTEGAIDFSDMIKTAREYIASGRYKCPYKYLLVDEFQDTSIGRYLLIKALIDQNPETRLFCVGDDWQSIFRFTGSDLSVITRFKDYFDYGHQTFLDITFRFNDKIAKVTEEFIQKNPSQIKKRLQTTFSTPDEPYEIIPRWESEREEKLKDCLSAIQSDPNRLSRKSVFILGRYNHNRPRNLEKLRREFPELTIDFLTVHKAKGLEADYVIIDPVDSGKYGFPSEIIDDPLLNLVLAQPEPFENAEERRVFYVAMTRARHKIFILCHRRNASKFAKELDNAKVISPSCPNCDSGTLEYRNRWYKWGYKIEYLQCWNCRYSRLLSTEEQNTKNSLLRAKKTSQVLTQDPDDDLPF